jgi:hypothetical protein
MYVSSTSAVASSCLDGFSTPCASWPLPWDSAVSQVHAALERVGDDWTLVDDGSSRNGAFLNGERVYDRRTLRDGDVMRIGLTPDRVYRAERAPTFLVNRRSDIIWRSAVDAGTAAGAEGAVPAVVSGRSAPLGAISRSRKSCFSALRP